MDLSSILPMLLNNGNSDDKMKTMLSAMSGNSNNSAPTNDRMQTILSAMNGGNGGNNSGENKTGDANTDKMQAMLSAMGKSNGGKPDIATIMSLANMNKKTDKQKPTGFKAIVNIAPNDILGILIKMFV